jgi:AraC-like DNA-binding protein
LDYYAAAVGECTIPHGFDDADPKTFQAEMSFAQLSEIGLCKVFGSRHRSFRGPSELARTPEHMYNMTTVTCPWTADHCGTRSCVSPGDILIYDSEYPASFDVQGSTYASLDLLVTEGWLRQWLPDPGQLVARTIPGNALWGQALTSFVRGLSPDLVVAAPLPPSVIADQLGSLLALAAGGAQSAFAAGSSSVRSLHDRIQDCIAQRCIEPQLTALDVAASVNVSVRTLHRALAAANETFGANLIDARARIAVRMLTSRLFKRVTISEIARRAGFVSPSHFARVIHSRTGRTPLKLRSSAGLGTLEFDPASRAK